MPRVSRSVVVSERSGEFLLAGDQVGLLAEIEPDDTVLERLLYLVIVRQRTGEHRFAGSAHADQADDACPATRVGGPQRVLSPGEQIVAGLEVLRQRAGHAGWPQAPRALSDNGVPALVLPVKRAVGREQSVEVAFHGRPVDGQPPSRLPWI